MEKRMRKQLLAALEELSETYPGWRFGQLVTNVAYWAKGPRTEAIWDVEDEEFLKAVREHLTRQSHRRKAAKGET